MDESVLDFAQELAGKWSALKIDENDAYVCTDTIRTEAIIHDDNQPDPYDRGHWRYASGMSCLDDEEKDAWYPGDTRYEMDGELYNEPWCWEKEEFLPVQEGGPDLHERDLRRRLMDASIDPAKAKTYNDRGIARRG
eukprot:GHVU01205389.1.p1 GENE.GHVU01205389.1~~GHVU01205389.1.p1  ORF type:complete len:137 (-),score=18.37 GHVU01205389.1:276-686(-)